MSAVSGVRLIGRNYYPGSIRLQMRIIGTGVFG
jgi:hypothetical protein